MARCQKKVLIVEGSPAQALAFGQLLEVQGLEVLWASDGQSGVEMALQFLPDVILLDSEMPGMNGLEVCRLIKHNVRVAQIPVVLLTVHAEPSTVIAGIDEGVVGFVPKGASAQAVLLETLRELNVLEDDSNAGPERRVPE